MSGTLAGAVKAVVEAAGLGLPCYRDRAPADAPLPFAVITEGIGRVAEPSGDFGDPAREHEVREQVQVDVWQAWKAADGTRLERYGLAEAVGRALHGATLPTVLGGRCWPPRVVASGRLGPAAGDPANLVRDTLTVEVLRVVTGTTA